MASEKDDGRIVLFDLDGHHVNLEEAMDFLGSIPLLQQLPAGLIRRIAQVVRPMHFVAGNALVREGDAGEGLYIIWKGKAEVSSPTEAGAADNILISGDYFGTACAGDSKEFHKADVVAIDEVTCLILEHQHSNLLSANSIWTQELKQDLGTLERILALEKLEVDIYRGITPHRSQHGHVFGGQLMGQALAAASKSVDPALLVHSLHAYFLRVGDESLPIIYQVTRVRDGHRFATRRVVAMQKGANIFGLTASFQRHEESVEHQDPMPEAPHPGQLLPREVISKNYQLDARIPSSIRKKLAAAPLVQSPLDMRPCDPIDAVNPVKSEARQRIWLRAKEKLSHDEALHRCVVAYASDAAFAGTILRPYRTNANTHFRLLSLDHSLWFHRPMRADEWLLYVMRSPVARGGRGLVIGHMYSQSGELVASAAQEGVFERYDRASKL